MKDYQLKIRNFFYDLQNKTQTMLGYPVNLSYDYSELYDFFKFSINNIGDPLSDGPYKLKAHEFEREVVEFIVNITGRKDKNFWGYVTNGGTEGNMYGLYVAREMYPNSIVYYSKEAHYSIPKVLKLLNMTSISIATKDNGEMDLEDLEEALRVNRTKTPIILATIGTTMKGAVDDVPSIRKIIQRLSFSNHYIHCDCALGGMILPFMDGAIEFGLAAGVHSLSVSGHKMLGSPMPCGVVVARKDFVDKIGSSIEYIGSIDTTLSGSRNGHTPLLLWYAIKKNGIDGYKKIIESCLEVADYLINQLKVHGIHAWRNDYSITVVIPRPSEKIVETWQLAVQGEIAHIIAMPQVTKKHVDSFIKDLIAEEL